jgi:hypothetical protein
MLNKQIVKKNAVDGVTLLALYSYGMYLLDGEVPRYWTMIKFLVMFMTATTVLHAINAEYVDAVPRGIVIVIAAKYVNSLGML